MKILLLAAEESAQIYAERLRNALAGHELRGYGDYGFETADLAAMGVDEVLKKLFFFIRVKRTMEKAICDWRPDVVCTVDYPGMNLKLAAFAKARGIRTVHVVCPQVWAWKAGRIPKIEAALDGLCCFFPFEPKLFRSGFATFVGHPMVDIFDEERRQMATVRDPDLLAFLPGSRLGEIEKIFPTMLDSLRFLDHPGLKVAVPAANAKARAAIERFLKDRQGLPPVLVQDGGARELLSRAGCAAVASGTATLEAALASCPTVLVYRAAPLFAFIARRVIKGVRFIGLANVIWDKCRTGVRSAAPASEAPMPELLQENFTAGALANILRDWLENPAGRERMVERLRASMALLKSDGDAIGNIARLVTKKGGDK